jgi:hypothetical protein
MSCPRAEPNRGSSILLLEFEIHLDAAVKRCTIIDCDAPCANIPLNPATSADGHSVFGEHVPMHFACDFDAVRPHGTDDCPISSDRKRTLQIEFALENTFDPEVTLAIETTPHHEMGADHPFG